MDERELRARLASRPFGHLATVRPDGSPHVVPIVFAAVGEAIYSAVDHKPKRSPNLQRLVNLRHDDRCSVLVDHLDDDWEALWWVRADGVATVVDRPPPDHPGLTALVARHPQYRDRVPAGPLLVIAVRRWSGWSAAGDGR